MSRDDEWHENWARRSNDEVAAAWIEFEARDRSGETDMADHPAWWAADAMMGLSHDDPLRALEICFRIAKSTDDPTVFEMLGAGPLEDLLSNDPTLFDAIAFEAGCSPGLIEALRHTWQSSIPDEVWGRLQDLLTPVPATPSGACPP